MPPSTTNHPVVVGGYGYGVIGVVRGLRMTTVFLGETMVVTTMLGSDGGCCWGKHERVLVSNENGDESVGNEFKPISYVNVVHREPMSLMNGGEKVSNHHVNEFPSYATKLSPTSSIKANLRKHEANVPNDVDYDVLLTLEFTLLMQH
ncbi:hypothetical protein Tco_0578754 [Tanacetum coccineum]